VAVYLTVVALLRRRAVVARALLVALLLGLAAFIALPDRYVSTATLLLTTSPYNDTSSTGGGTVGPVSNPMFGFSRSLNTTAGIVVEAVNRDPSVDSLEATHRATITISDVGGAEFLGSNGPFLFLTGTSTASSQAAQDVVVRGLQLTKKELADCQASLGAPTAQLISALTVIEPTIPTVSVVTRLEGAVLGFVLGFVVTLGVVHVRENRRFPTLRVARESVAAKDAAEAPESRPMHTDVAGPEDDLEPAAVTVPAVLATTAAPAPARTTLAVPEPVRPVPPVPPVPSTPALPAPVSAAPTTEPTTSPAPDHVPVRQAPASRRPRPRLCRSPGDAQPHLQHDGANAEGTREQPRRPRLSGLPPAPARPLDLRQVDSNHVLNARKENKASDG
jgi:hypothetical protein